MGTKNIIIILVLLGLVGIGAWFLLSGEKELKEGLLLPGEEGVEEEVEEGAETLTEILGKAKSIAPLKYDVVVATPGQAAATTKVWLKGKKMRGEGAYEGQDVTYILDMEAQVAYVYISAQNIAMKMDIGEVQESVGESPTEQSESIEKYNPTVVGSEVLDGKNCLVVEYTTETAETKMWIWEKHGLPIKTESTTTKGTSVAELKNIEFGDIPDSMFELPAGIQIIEMPGL